MFVNICTTSKLYNNNILLLCNFSAEQLSAYGGTEIPNHGSCQIYVKGLNNPSPKAIQTEVVDVDGPAIITFVTYQYKT